MARQSKDMMRKDGMLNACEGAVCSEAIVNLDLIRVRLRAFHSQGGKEVPIQKSCEVTAHAPRGENYAKRGGFGCSAVM
jgi:hypothetical protein